jgi:hypothetical protein
LNADGFNLESLISSMKELRHMQLGDQVRQALEGAKLGLDPAALKDLVHELESDIEEHIGRLEKISEVMTTEERRQPELMEATRRQEVAFKSGCDTEEVDSLCEAFSRAREILAGAKGHGGVLDLKLLFSNIPGLSGIDLAPGSDGVRKVPAQILEEILGGKFRTPPSTPDTEPSLEELFDLEKTATPRNRLPKDWKP